MDIDTIAYQVIGAAFAVHNELGHGCLEKVYERAMLVELEDSGLAVLPQYPISVVYKGRPLGNYYADLFTNDLLVVELKAPLQILPKHEVQLINYL